jgi:putative transposase|tara:strand:- start:32 stop:1246 length:1215 start_codon:yes stop_codon:yes gene_type:complete
MASHDDLLDELLKEYQTPEDLLGKHGIVKQLTKDLIERALAAELTDHLGYDKHAVAGRGSGNSRNGTSGKTLKTEQGDLPLEIPRDRQGDFEPLLVAKGQRRSGVLDEQIISLYARGLTVAEIQGHLEEIYGTEVSRGLISTVTDAVVEEVTAWQNRPLDAVYPIVYFDALRIKIRTDHTVTNQAVYLALGVNMEGEKELLGLWVAQNEGAKFWLGVLNELKNRGVDDLFIACIDGLTGFPEAVEAAFPDTQVQLCIVHMVRNSLRYVPWKQRKAVATDLKLIYQAASLQEAEIHLAAFEETWDAQFPTISQSWRQHWVHLTPFFAFPPDIRRAIYTTNAIESLNSTLRKIIKTRRVFPSEEAATKLLYLALQNIAKKWTKPIKNWRKALNQFAILFDGRVPTP